MVEPNPKDMWLDELEALVPQVKQWFREKSKRFAVPSDAGCRAVAFYMLALRDRQDDQRDDRREKAIQYGKLFLHHMEPERRRLEQWVSVYSRSQPVRYWEEHDKDLLFRINEIRKHMEVVLAELSPELDGKPDPIRKLAEAAQGAWAETNNGRAPSARSTEGPLSKFVQKALEAVGLNYSEGYISDVLKRHRRIGRGGRFA